MILFLLHTPYTFALLRSQDPLPKHSSSSRSLPLQLYFYLQATCSSTLYVLLSSTLQHKQSTPISQHFGYLSTTILPYRASASLVIFHKNKHTTLAFSLTGILSPYTAFTVFICYRIGTTIGLVPNPGATLTDGFPRLPSWDDWVPQDRIRKMNEDNKALAANLKFEMDKLLRPKAVAASNKKKAAGSDLSSNRGSEERHATPITGRGQKRGRDYEIEKVREKLPSRRGGPSSSFHGSKGKSLARADEESGLRRSKRLKTNPACGAKDLLASSSEPVRPSKPGDVPSSSHGAGGRPPTINEEKSGLRRSTRLKANPARGAKDLLAPSSRSASSTKFRPKSGPSNPRSRKSNVPQPLPISAARYETSDSREQVVTPAQMRRAWAASVHHTASSCFDWDNLHSDIRYDKLDAAEKKAGFPPKGFRYLDEQGNPKPPRPPRRYPPIKLPEGFPPEQMHLYYTMKRIGLVDEIPPSRGRSRPLTAGIPPEDNTPEDLVDYIKEHRAHLIEKSNGRVQFTNRASDL